MAESVGEKIDSPTYVSIVQGRQMRHWLPPNYVTPMLW